MNRHRILDPIWHFFVTGHRGMETRVRSMLWRNAGILLTLSAAWPWLRFWPVFLYLSAVVAMAGHRTWEYVATWTFRRHVHEPVATVLDNIIRPRTPSGHGLVHVDIPRDFRDNADTALTVHVPMDWPATKEDMTAVMRALEQRLATDTLTATWTLTGRKPYGRFTLPAKPPGRVDMTDMLAAADTCADTAVVMGSGTRACPVVTFDLAMESPHLLLNAGSGAGKSELLAWIVGQFMRRGYGVACLDAKFVSHMWLRRVPGVLYAAESQELHEALIWLDEELLRRARFVSSGGDPDALVPLVVVLEEMTTATGRLRAYWKSIEGKGQSPALAALAALANMGREMRVHVLMAGQSITAKVTGGPEGRESFGGRALSRASSNAWRMLASQIRPIPRRSEVLGRWHLVVGDTLKEFQAPFCDIKNQMARLIEWATGGLSTPDVPAMMLGGAVSSSTCAETEVPSSDIMTTTLADYVKGKDLSLSQIQKWRERYAETFPEAVGTRGRAALYDPADLDLFVLARTNG